MFLADELVDGPGAHPCGQRLGLAAVRLVQVAEQVDGGAPFSRVFRLGWLVQVSVSTVDELGSGNAVVGVSLTRSSINPRRSYEARSSRITPTSW
jgi:hypothetical protein